MAQTTHPFPTAVLFDVDGTLVDTNYVHTLAWWQALRQHGHLVTSARIHRAIGLGSDKILAHLLGEHDEDIDAEVLAAHDTLVGEWHERVRPFDGAADLLRACRSGGAAVVLATSAGERDLEALRRVLDADDAITGTTSSADAERSKPDTDILEVALDLVGARPGQAVFVGDAVWDVQAARRLGMPCVGLLCGGTSAGELLEAGAHEVWDDPAHLLQNLGGSRLSGH